MWTVNNRKEERRRKMKEGREGKEGDKKKVRKGIGMKGKESALNKHDRSPVLMKKDEEEREGKGSKI